MQGFARSDVRIGYAASAATDLLQSQSRRVRAQSCEMPDPRLRTKDIPTCRAWISHHGSTCGTIQNCEPFCWRYRQADELCAHQAICQDRSNNIVYSIAFQRGPAEAHAVHLYSTNAG